MLHRCTGTADGFQHFLLSYNRERALVNPALAMSLVFHRMRPRFGFSGSQQELLESALLDESDREFASKLGLTEDAVKKRWRAIYDRVAAVEPKLVAGTAAGASQRRALLGYLRQHLEEIRPYKATPIASPAIARQARSASFAC